LLLRATEPLDEGQVGTDWRSRWETATSTVDVVGNHFTILESEVGATAEAIKRWLAGLG
jgi:hypothetical protein